MPSLEAGPKCKPASRSQALAQDVEMLAPPYMGRQGIKAASVGYFLAASTIFGSAGNLTGPSLAQSRETRNPITLSFGLEAGHARPNEPEFGPWRAPRVHLNAMPLRPWETRTSKPSQVEFGPGRPS